MKKGAIVLCGGKSSRMGFDKASLAFGPEKLLQRIVRVIAGVVDPDSIVVVAASGQVLPELSPSIIVTTDERPNRGPLEGLASGLRALPNVVEAAFVTSCDAPLLVPEFVERMFHRLGTFDIAVPRDGDFLHPLAAVYRPSVLDCVNRLLSLNQLRLSSLMSEVKTHEIPVDELRQVDPLLSTLRNLNHPDEYQAALFATGLLSSG